MTNEHHTPYGTCLCCEKTRGTRNPDGICVVCTATGRDEQAPESVSAEADRLVSGPRDEEHGPWEANASVAARICWALELDAAEPDDLPLMLLALKLARMRHDPENRDNYVDAIGYVQLAYETRQGRS